MILDERVRAELAATTRFRDIQLLDAIDSTNRLLLDEAAAGAPEGLVAAADLQTAGRGRLDRTWETEPGAGLLVSVLLKPAGLPIDRWHLVTAAAGLAAQDACDQVAGVRADLKWPNDLMWDGRKLAGILAEIPQAVPPNEPSQIVVGMGLNVHAGPSGSAHLDEAAGTRVSRADLLAAWLTVLDRLLGNWDDVAGLYRDRCATIGQTVDVEQIDGRVVRGRAESVDELGRLIVQPDAGEAVVVTVGDVTHLRTAN